MDYLEILKDLAILIKLVDDVKKIKRRSRSCCVRKINRDNKKNGFFVRTFLRMKKEDPIELFKHCRMNSEEFDMLLDMVKDFIKKKSIRKPVSPECRLAITLSHLSQGVNVQYLAWSYKLGKETVRQIILETCEIIWQTLSGIYVTEPNYTDFVESANLYESLWNLPHCVGSIDGKHIAITKPRNSGGLYFNYKKYHSIVLLAACDARCIFTYIDVGSYGGNSDGGIFANSSFGKRILNKELPLPSPSTLPNSDIVAPYYFVADAAFPLAQHVIKPFRGSNLTPQQDVYNKRICRARQTIENSFGILTARYRILLNTIHMEPENAEKVVLASIALHNYIMLDNTSRRAYCPPNYIDRIDSDGTDHPGEWRLEITPADPIQPSATQHRFNGMNATNFRNKLLQYFNS